MSDGILRRNRVDLMTPAERAITDAMRAVEEMAADIRLTEAVTLLGAAREQVADYVDGKEFQAHDAALRARIAELEEELARVHRLPELEWAEVSASIAQRFAMLARLGHQDAAQSGMTILDKGKTYVSNLRAERDAAIAKWKAVANDEFGIVKANESLVQELAAALHRAEAAEAAIEALAHLQETGTYNGSEIGELVARYRAATAPVEEK